MPTTTTIISPFDIATMGVLSSEPLTIASDGFIVFLTEEIVEVPRLVGGGGDFGDWFDRQKKKKKRITARVVIKGEEYSQTIEVDDLNLKLSDVKVKVHLEEGKPVLKLLF